VSIMLGQMSLFTGLTELGQRSRKTHWSGGVHTTIRVRMRRWGGGGHCSGALSSLRSRQICTQPIVLLQVAKIGTGLPPTSETEARPETFSRVVQDPSLGRRASTPPHRRGGSKTKFIARQILRTFATAELVSARVLPTSARVRDDAMAWNSVFVGQHQGKDTRGELGIGRVG
jgi:hypothetical protein